MLTDALKDIIYSPSISELDSIKVIRSHNWSDGRYIKLGPRAEHGDGGENCRDLG
jgi:hypothetical protein